METYETSATVEDRGEVRVAGVPFGPGTEVEVTISPKSPAGGRSTSSGDAVGNDGAGLRWVGNVLVHGGVGAGPWSRTCAKSA